jgi:anti-anti-sigma factor
MLPSSSPRIPSPRSTPHLRCTLVPDRDVIAVQVSGEIDIATGGVVDATLRDLREAGFRRVHLDLRDVGFMDVRGIALLLRWTDLALLERFTLTIDPGVGAAWRVICLVGVAERLRCAPARPLLRLAALTAGTVLGAAR